MDHASSSQAQRDRMLSATAKLEQSGERLQQGKKLLAETEVRTRWGSGSGPQHMRTDARTCCRAAWGPRVVVLADGHSGMGAGEGGPNGSGQVAVLPWAFGVAARVRAAGVRQGLGCVGVLRPCQCGSRTAGKRASAGAGSV